MQRCDARSTCRGLLGAPIGLNPTYPGCSAVMTIKIADGFVGNPRLNPTYPGCSAVIARQGDSFVTVVTPVLILLTLDAAL